MTNQTFTAIEQLATDLTESFRDNPQATDIRELARQFEAEINCAVNRESLRNVLSELDSLRHRPTICLQRTSKLWSVLLNAAATRARAIAA